MTLLDEISPSALEPLEPGILAKVGRSWERLGILCKWLLRLLAIGSITYFCVLAVFPTSRLFGEDDDSAFIAMFLGLPIWVPLVLACFNSFRPIFYIVSAVYVGAYIYLAELVISSSGSLAGVGIGMWMVLPLIVFAFLVMGFALRKRGS